MKYKFRSWLLEHEEMWDNPVFHPYREYIVVDGDWEIPSDKVVIMLYSHQVDSSGKFVCEGDIVKGNGNRRYVVRFGKCRDNGEECFYMDNLDDTKDYSTYIFKNVKNLTVIGNIYEGE